MATFDSIGLAEPSTITKSVATVTLTRNSSATHQEILSIGDTESTNGIARVLNTDPASTEWGLVVRNRPSGTQTIDGTVQAAQDGTWTVTANPATPAAGTYFVVRASDGSNFIDPGTEYTEDGVIPSNAGKGTLIIARRDDALASLTEAEDDAVGARCDSRGALWVREAGRPTYHSTTVLVSVSASSQFTELISSAAGVTPCVYAFSVTSTHVAPSTCEFLSSTNAPKWGVQVGSGSSGVTGANLSVAPPGRLFAAAASANLTFRASAAGDYRVSLSYFTE